ncbi:MAG: right-handed parallel beta-helix repeat-containing protein [Myxococcota bacterium]
MGVLWQIEGMRRVWVVGCLFGLGCGATLATPDAGGRGDGGAWDAGEIADAGDDDAGPGAPDGGSFDGGSFDAGGTDAGRADGGRGDAGAADGGPGDGGDELGFDPSVCPCTREILTGESTVDLSSLDAGSVVCLRATTAATRGRLTITGLNGTAASPVLIRNCDGQVTVSSSTTGAPLTLSGRGFRVSGGGAPGVTYGLKFTGPSASFLVSVGRASEFELDHLELTQSSFAGITAKVDPSSTSCGVGDRRYDSFVMSGVHIHHNWVHDLPNGEGMYLGNSFYSGAGARYCYASGNTTCDRSACPGATEQFPHELRRVRVHHNLIQHTGWDGLQVGSAVDDCVLSDNRIEDYGELAVASQQNGIQVGEGSSCIVERNTVTRGPTGINVLGIGDVVVRNNLVTDFRSVGVVINPRPTPLATDIVPTGYRGGFTVSFDTLVSGAGATNALVDVNAAAVGDVTVVDNVISNNLIVFPTSSWLRRTDARYGWTVAGNLQFPSAGAAGLGPDFCPSPTSTAVDAADAGPAVTSDLRGAPRPLGAGPDVGALECH